MWQEQGGGFDAVSPSQQGGSRPAGDRPNDENGMVPVCLHSMINSVQDDKPTAPDGSPFGTVTIVGRVLQADGNPQRVEYTIGDYSGEVLTGKEYNINDDDDLMPEMIKEGTMVRVYGTLKTFQGKQQITIARIHPIEDPNEITTHLLELTYSYLRAKKGSSHMDVSAGGDINEQVKRVISAHKTMDGISINEIKQTLSHLSSVDVINAINFLSGEGHIYSTIDDDHYKATEDLK